MLGELDGERRLVVCDLEAGVGTVLRLEAEQADVVVVVCEPTAKAIEVARRLVEMSAPLARVIVVANRVREDADLDAIRGALGDHETLVVPEDAAVAAADRDGRAPIDAAADSPAVRAIVELAGRLTG